MPATESGFDWTLIRSFLAVIETGSLLAAARRLQMTQPTIGRHIENLEAQLSVDLFERTGRGMVPTLAAKKIAEHARVMQQGADQLARAITSTDNQPSGLVRVSASRIVAEYLLPEMIQQLHEPSADIDIAIVASDSVTNLLRREADIAIRMVRPEQSSLIVRRIGQFNLLPCASEQYLERYGMPRSIADLLKHRLVGPDKDKALLDQMGGLARGMGVDPQAIRRAVRSDDFPVQAAAIRAGLGVGFASSHVIASSPELRVLDLNMPIPPLPVWLAVHREIRANARIRRVFDSLASSLKAQASLA